MSPYTYSGSTKDYQLLMFLHLKGAKSKMKAFNESSQRCI